MQKKTHSVLYYYNNAVTDNLKSYKLSQSIVLY